MYILCDPEPKWRDIVEHLSSERSDRIFDAGWHFGKDLTGDEAVTFEAAKRLGQGFLADACDVLHDAREPHWTPVFNDDAHRPERPLVSDARDHLTRECIFVVSKGLAKLLDMFPTKLRLWADFLQ